MLSRRRPACYSRNVQNQSGTRSTGTLMETTPSTHRDEMACRELVEVITDYLGGTLAEEDRRRFEAHLEECPYCVTYLEHMRETIDSLGELTAESLSPQAREDLLAAFRDWRAAR
jgi:anti-sigma factor RsiW